MYNYICVDQNGYIGATFESTKQAGVDQTDLVEVDAYIPENVGCYYLNGEISAPPQEGYYWRWDEDTSQFIETPIPTE